MSIRLQRLQLVCVFFPSACHGPLHPDDRIKVGAGLESCFGKRQVYELTNYQIIPQDVTCGLYICRRLFTSDIE